MEFKEVLNRKIDRSKLPIGSRKGSILALDLNEISSIIITGETGSGKSVMINQMLYQLEKNFSTDEVRFILIDTSGVELNTYDNNDRTILSAFNDLDKSQEVLFKVLEELERRQQLILEHSVLSIDGYNEVTNNNVPNLVVVIDDNQSLLNNDDVSSMIHKILDKLDVRFNMLFIMATNNVYNDFFDTLKDRPNSIQISFDQAESDVSSKTAMPFSDDLLTGKFIINKSGDYEEYNNFEITDNIL